MSRMVAILLLAAPLLAEPPPRTGTCPDALRPFDELLTSFMAEHRVPGASLAVVRHGRLVVARGYGWADREEKAPVRPESLFRIASVSKPITAVAVLQLVEAGKLELEDKAVDVLEIRDLVVDPRLADVTIHQLLRHTAGFDRGRSFDPMFRSVRIARALEVVPPAKPWDIIRFMAGRPLDFAPGQGHAYSNFGYCMLGRVIEKASGEPYEAYVRERVLKPLGITRMRVGKSLRRDRAEDEVVYYVKGPPTARAVVGAMGHKVPVPYGTWYHEALDAHGGWIGSATGLARFAAAFDDPAACPVLPAKRVRQMFLRPPGRAGYDAEGEPRPAYYACGWLVRPLGRRGANHWHGGLLPGTATLLVRRWDGLSWVVLFNTARGKNGVVLSDAIDPLLHRAANAVEHWPERLDLSKD
ncbi:MAG: serine hydrolase domain-containing protein [Planctomycetota bacterium]